MKQDQLIHQVNTWTHFIGGYYKTPDHFVREAKRSGISRRIPAQVARGMSFGDRVVLLRYGGPGSVQAFAEMRISSLVLDHEIAQKVGEQLQAEGKATYTEGVADVQRECGSYSVLGTYAVDTDMADVIDRAIKIGEQEGRDVFVMVGGKLSHVYDSPVMLSPAPKFNRGFAKIGREAKFEFGPASDVERQVVSIEGYHKAARPKRSKPLALIG